MSAVARVCTKELLPIFNDMEQFISKEAQSVPMGVIVSKDRLTICMSKSISYVASIDAEDTTPIEVSVMFTPVMALVSTEEEYITIGTDQRGLIVTTDTCDIVFSLAYSSIKPLDFGAVKWIPFMNIASACSGLTSLVSTGFSSLYKKDMPVIVYGDVSEISYRNVIVQCRTIGLPFEMSLSTANCKLLIKFKPTYYSRVDEWLYLKRDNAVLILPYAQNNTKNEITSYLEDMCPPITLTLGKYLDKIQAINKMKYLRVSLVFYRDGVVTRAVNSTADISIPLGTVDGEMLCTFMVPVNVWYLCMKIIKAKRFQILYNKEGLICLRTSEEIILLHAIC